VPEVNGAIELGVAGSVAIEADDSGANASARRRCALNQRRRQIASVLLRRGWGYILKVSGLDHLAALEHRLDDEVRWLALFAHSLYLADTGRFDESCRFADEPYRVAPDARTHADALMLRGDSNLWKGNTAEGAKDYAQAVALAREADDPAFLARALLLEAQALMAAGLVDEAAARLDEARAVGTPVDANILYYLDTFVGDLAVVDRRPADALEPYARSLEHALADGNLTQIVLDLVCVAEALAALGHDAESLEVAGIGESQSAELGAASDTLHDEHLRALERRLGPTKSAELKESGRAAGPAERVARACQLARSRAPAHAVARE